MHSEWVACPYPIGPSCPNIGCNECETYMSSTGNVYNTHQGVGQTGGEKGESVDSLCKTSTTNISLIYSSNGIIDLKSTIVSLGWLKHQLKKTYVNLLLPLGRH